MAKHKRRWDESIYHKYIREGRGQGFGINYKPWIYIQDFASLGMVSRIKGRTTGRVYHMMSNHEANLFYLLDWSDNVIDIREQFPLLDIGKAIGIAESKKIRYPYDVVSGFPYILTTDFYIETVAGRMAIAVKPSSELSKIRVREKLEIERCYWKTKNVNWSIITEYEINRTKARNIEWLSQAEDLQQLGLSKELQNIVTDFFISRYPCSDELTEFFSQIEGYYGLSYGMGLNIFKHLVYHKKIEFNIEQPICIMGVSSYIVNSVNRGDTNYV